MKIAVLGATGPTGQQFIAMATAAGHEITALARSAARLDQFPGIRVIEGDAMDADTIDVVLEGQDAVFSSLGLSAVGANDVLVTVCTTAMAHVRDTMERGEAIRMVVISTVGVGDSHDDSPYVTRLWDLMGPRLYDKETMEVEIATIPTDWTIIRAPRITDDPESGGYRVGERLRVPDDAHVARLDLCRFALSEIERPQHIGRALTIAV